MEGKKGWLTRLLKGKSITQTARCIDTPAPGFTDLPLISCRSRTYRSGDRPGHIKREGEGRGVKESNRYIQNLVGKDQHNLTLSSSSFLEPLCTCARCQISEVWPPFRHVQEILLLLAAQRLLPGVSRVGSAHLVC